jgi:hypothetical protein
MGEKAGVMCQKTGVTAQKMGGENSKTGGDNFRAGPAAQQKEKLMGSRVWGWGGWAKSRGAFAGRQRSGRCRGEVKSSPVSHQNSARSALLGFALARLGRLGGGAPGSGAFSRLALPPAGG